MTEWIIEEPAFLVLGQDWDDPDTRGTGGILRLSGDELRFTDFNDEIIVQIGPDQVVELTARWRRVTFLEMVIARPPKGLGRTLRFRMNNRSLDFAHILAEKMPEDAPYLELKEAPEALIFAKWYWLIFGRRNMSLTEVFRNEKAWPSWLATVAVPLAVLTLVGLGMQLFFARFGDPSDALIMGLVERRAFIYVMPAFGLVLLFGPAIIDHLVALGLGGRGDVLTHFYVRSLFQTPLWAVSASIILATSLVSYVALLGLLVALLIQLYSLYLVWVSNQAVHRIGPWRSALTALIFLAVQAILLVVLLSDLNLLLR